MSIMLNRTWNYLSQSLASSPTFGGYPGPRWTLPDNGTDQEDRTHHLPPVLAHFLQTLYLVQTKSEESSLVLAHLKEIQAKLKETDVKPAVMADALVRAMACHTLGYDVKFIQIYALQLAQKGSILEKKMGYLACTLLLSENDELILLLINTILKDLKSQNVIEVNIALIAAIHLTPKEMAPMLLPVLQEKTTHTKDFIRKKALICLESIMQKAPDYIPSLETTVYNCLSDPDPGVVGVAVQVMRSVTLHNTTCDSGLIQPLIEILNQILDHKFPKDYVYHGVEAPWVQMDLMILLAVLLERSDWSDHHAGLISRSLLRSLEGVSPKETIGQAIIYQCIKTIAVMNQKTRGESKIYQQLVDKSLFYINKCLQSKHNNMKYMGLASLYEFFRYPPTPKLTEVEQENVLACLKHPDDSIQRKALSFLYELANDENVTGICATLVEFIRSSKDPFQTEELIIKCMQVAKKLHQSNLGWYTGLLLKLLQASKSNREVIVVEIQESLGAPLTDEEDSDKRSIRHKSGLKLSKVLENLCNKEKPPPIVQRLFLWSLVQDFQTDVTANVSKVLEIGRQALALDLDSPESEKIVISSLDSVFCLIHLNECSHEDIVAFIELCAQQYKNPRIQDLALEIQFFWSNLADLQGMEKPDEECPDWTLSSADEFVVKCLTEDQDLEVYDPRQKLISKSNSPLESESFRFTPYHVLEESPSKRSNPSKASKDHTDDRIPVKQVWSIYGRLENPENPQATKSHGKEDANTFGKVDNLVDLESVALEALEDLS
ncbi:hypothetical protein TCAL_01859 [Tigriopus californicus]|uniref:Clathrin/coatomer adaptor adaptin-like N-terminal domain-containing protein n=1 Tax=Tigriopus californicus TaxID=6832 RepID=A0A553NFT9_TIGCA|nr:AP-4 complex subunit epsilon-1-like [Tigriopus californicus]TRY64310.1 hypothetical protein TCAL_01859 [Tigriopus californicus]|eukprot:TCALIF_01859-PA protein Name:"Similar to At1g31730 AP-4 complex subunit epsilon (Arabidopsis thaliana)" AED:0.15 eAED:0.15 QI:121/1/1/1/1/1/5/329/776